MQGWKTHIRAAYLRFDGAVHKFNHGMYQALRVNNDLDVCNGYVKQPVSFDISNPLFIRVAERLYLRSHIQEGCRNACSGHTGQFSVHNHGKARRSGQNKFRNSPVLAFEHCQMAEGSLFHRKNLRLAALA